MPHYTEAKKASEEMRSVFDSLNEGDEVTFKVVPAGSYTRLNEVYIIETKGNNSMYFRSKVRGSGTFDAKWAINRAVIA